ncbi:MAG: hypothetical protein WCI00_00775 [bacterium]
MKDYKKMFSEGNTNMIMSIKLIDWTVFISLVFIIPIAFVYRISIMSGARADLAFPITITSIILVLILYYLYQGLRSSYSKRLKQVAMGFALGYKEDILDALKNSYFPELNQHFIDQLHVLMSKKDWLNYKTFEFNPTGMKFDYQNDKDAVLDIPNKGYHYYLTGWTYAAHLSGFIFTFDKRPMNGNGPIEEVRYYIHRN